MAGEKKIERDITKLVENSGGIWFKIHIDQYGPKGFPDLVIVLPGIGTVHVETKDKGKKPTDIQEYTIRQINLHGGQAFWCDSLESFIDKIKEYAD